mmetsp:Transcript_38163/g.44451  ORF Transcript_38163/g.44451 Transcript_38163/m.44451 type:complete len:92 (+) Transcript_38163:51-326(+)
MLTSLMNGVLRWCLNDRVKSVVYLIYLLTGFVSMELLHEPFVLNISLQVHKNKHNPAFISLLKQYSISLPLSFLYLAARPRNAFGGKENEG